MTNITSPNFLTYFPCSITITDDGLAGVVATGLAGSELALCKTGGGIEIECVDGGKYTYWRKPIMTHRCPRLTQFLFFVKKTMLILLTSVCSCFSPACVLDNGLERNRSQKLCLPLIHSISAGDVSNSQWYFIFLIGALLLGIGGTPLQVQSDCHLFSFFYRSQKAFSGTPKATFLILFNHS